MRPRIVTADGHLPLRVEDDDVGGPDGDAGASSSASAGTTRPRDLDSLGIAASHHRVPPAEKVGRQRVAPYSGSLSSIRSSGASLPVDTTSIVAR